MDRLFIERMIVQVSITAKKPVLICCLVKVWLKLCVTCFWKLFNDDFKSRTHRWRYQCASNDHAFCTSSKWALHSKPCISWELKLEGFGLHFTYGAVRNLYRKWKVDRHSNHWKVAHTWRCICRLINSNSLKKELATLWVAMLRTIHHTVGFRQKGCHLRTTHTTICQWCR